MQFSAQRLHPLSTSAPLWLRARTSPSAAPHRQSSAANQAGLVLYRVLPARRLTKGVCIEMSAILVGFSGKYGAGKDAIASTVFSRLGIAATQMSFAAALKAEASRMYVACEYGHIRPAFGFELEDGSVWQTGRLDDLALEVARPKLADGSAAPVVPAAPVPCSATFGTDFKGAPASRTARIEAEVFAQAAPTLVCESMTALPVNAYDRTPAHRKMLQVHGTDIRRFSDDNYWVKKGLESAAASMADGVSVYCTDVRFTNEADGILDAGGVVVRIEISPEVQRARLLSRDGSLPSAEAANHPSETQLDDYDRFSVVVSNDGTLDETVSKVLEFLASELGVTIPAAA